jgi:hypothetical protein
MQEDGGDIVSVPYIGVILRGISKPPLLVKGGELCDSFVNFNLFTPTLILPRQWGGWVKMIETDTPTFVLPRQWGGRVMVDFLFCLLLIFSPHFCPFP